MRKESATIRKCHSRLSSLGLDSTVAFHKSKLILKIYRDVVWVLSERAQELQEYAWELGDQDLSTGLCYLENFAPDIDLQDFEEKVCCVIQSQMLVDVINRALLRLKRYPDRGELYYEILSKQFIYRFNSTEKELLDELNMERSVFYDRKKEAIYLFSICLFGYVKLVTMIPADPQMAERDLRKKHLRVAPYCRVSTDKEEQLSSYEAQIEYYTEKIDANPDWTMVRLYADEGITGTSAKKRKDFLQMIRDCERGKIDLVITKSVSRFCRNTLDGLNYVRRLKRHGVGVYFEKENVNTLFMDNEMILTFMMSQAQAESESLSGNVKWGHRKNFKDGKVYYHCKNFLGYRWGADGQPEIDPEQAAVVRRIFSRFLLGHSVRQITTDLMTDGIKTATGKTVWHDSVIQKMLCNEKYIGDALLQKTYIADLFTREKRINNGELPKYYVHDCHPAIIDRGTFQKVQEELARRSSLKKTSSKAKTQLGKYCGKYVLSELLVCGECGSPYRRVIWTQKGVKRVVWRCQNRLEHGRKICKHSPTLDEGDIHDAVISAMNELFQTQVARNAVKASISAVLAGEEQTLSLPAVELQIRNLQERQLELFQLIVSAGADCTDYDEELRQVNMAKTKLMAKKAELEKEQRGAAAFEERLAELDAELEQSCGALTDFDELTVRQLVSNIKVLDKDSLLICFKDGTEITQAMQRRQTA